MNFIHHSYVHFKRYNQWHFDHAAFYIRIQQHSARIGIGSSALYNRSNKYARTQAQSICAFVVSSNRRLLRSVPISMSLYLLISLSVFSLSFVLLVIPFILHTTFSLPVYHIHTGLCSTANCTRSIAFYSSSSTFHTLFSHCRNTQSQIKRRTPNQKSLTNQKITENKISGKKVYLKSSNKL